MQFNHILAFDVSKESFAVHLRSTKDTLWKGDVKNNFVEVKNLFTMIKKDFRLKFKECLVCLEATGLYGFHLLTFTSCNGIATWVAHAQDIKQSLGMKRGKSDPVDAERIAEYAYRFQDKAVLWSPPRPIIIELKALIGCRDRLVGNRVALENPLREMQDFSKKSIYLSIEKSCHKALEQIKKAIDDIEFRIMDLIKKDKDLYEMYKRLDSILGVGPVTSVAFIVETNEFKDFPNAKKIACHCGVAPFSYSSGKRKGKAHVSHKANKKLKTLLDLCARSAVLAKGEFRDYYLRKLEEGKSPMLVRNNIRNKIVLRMFAIVRDKSMYEKKFNTKVG